MILLKTVDLETELCSGVSLEGDSNPLIPEKQNQTAAKSSQPSLSLYKDSAALLKEPINSPERPHTVQQKQESGRSSLFGFMFPSPSTAIVNQ